MDKSLLQAFITWAQRHAIPLSPNPEAPLPPQAQAVLDRMLAGKRFLFLGEPDHFFVEKFPYRLMFIQYLYERGWGHVGMETGRSIGQFVDRFLETGNVDYLARTKHPSRRNIKIFGKTLEFSHTYERRFAVQLRALQKAPQDRATRIRYFGYDLDLGAPLTAVEVIKDLLIHNTDDTYVQQLLHDLSSLHELSLNRQLARMSNIWRTYSAQQDSLVHTIGHERSTLLRYWLLTLREDLHAENRPQQQQPRAYTQWLMQRENIMFRHLKESIEPLGPDNKIILMGHNYHMCKDSSRLHLGPRPSCIRPVRCYVRSLAYAFHAHLRGYPVKMWNSLGTMLHKESPAQCLSIWSFYGYGRLMGKKGPVQVRLQNDTLESLLAQVGDRYLLPLHQADDNTRKLLAHANFRGTGGAYSSGDLTALTDALYFVKTVNAE